MTGGPGMVPFELSTCKFTLLTLAIAYLIAALATRLAAQIPARAS